MSLSPGVEGDAHLRRTGLENLLHTLLVEVGFLSRADVDLYAVRVEELAQVDQSVRLDFEVARRQKVLHGNRLVIPESLLQLQIRVVSVVLEQPPARLTLHLEDAFAHEQLERVEVDTCDRLSLVKVTIDDELLQCSDVGLV